MNGVHAWQMLNNASYPMRHCVQVEALRYQYLNKPIQTTTEEDIPRRRKLLILGDYTAAKTHQMISLIESISSELNDFSTICVKPHPASFLDLSLFPQLLGELKEQPLDTLLPEIDVVIASVNTAATLEVFCKKIPLINYLDPADLNFSSLRNHPNARFVSSAEEILKLLQNEQWLSTPSGANSSDFFWLDEELPRWTQLIQATFAEHSKVNEQCSN